MSTGSWFKAHRKQVITHTSIIAAFVLFTIFVAGPFFDTFEAISGESRLHEFPLPDETKDIKYSFWPFTTDGHTVVDISGWAFIEGQDSENSQVFIVLKSANRTYIFDTTVLVRRDVTEALQELNVNLDYSGFKAIIPITKIENGEYIVGIYIRKGDIEALQYTNKAITKSKGTIELTE